MQFTTFSFVFAVVLAAWSVAALPVKREVFNPQITFPTAADVFTAGDTITVTWDTSKLEGTTNKGMLVLGQLTDDGNEHLDLDHPLATKFFLTDGSHNVTFPDSLQTATNYILDLFGDSGNISPKFTINSLP